MKYSIEDCQKHALSKMGKCLSQFYTNKDKLKWQCANGHIWDALWSNVRDKSSWCPHCAGRYVTIDDIKTIASQRRGECLENEYRNAKTLMKFRCEFGHTWHTTANRLKNGTWCNNKECISKAIHARKTKYSLEFCHKIASKKNGKCLSNKYVSVNKHMEWECEYGHKWETTLSKIIGGAWCHACAKKLQGNRIYNIDDLRQACNVRGFTLLSNKYIGTSHKIRVKCSVGHEWDVVTNSILHQITGCPYCNRYLTQEKCRYIFEILTGQKWIKNRKIVPPYEVDGYCESLNMVFEYNGEQHYKNNVFHNKNRSLSYQIKRDQIVRERLRLLGVSLIEIPFWEAKDDQQLVRFIKQFISHVLFRQNIDISEFYKNYSHCRRELEKTKLAAQNRGGQCISDHYVNSNTKLRFRCKEGHEWLATPSKIKLGRWCPECCRINNTIRERTQGRLTKGRNLLEEIKKIIRERNGECLSTQYINCHTKMLFQCGNCGTKWTTTPESIRRGSRKKGNRKGSWCPTCAKKRRKEIWKQKYNAGEFSLSRKSIPKPRKPQLDYHRIWSFKQQGMGIKAIGRELGTSHSAVSYALKRIDRLGIDWLRTII